MILHFFRRKKIYNKRRTPNTCSDANVKLSIEDNSSVLLSFLRPAPMQLKRILVSTSKRFNIEFLRVIWNMALPKCRDSWNDFSFKVGEFPRGEHIVFF